MEYHFICSKSEIRKSEHCLELIIIAGLTGKFNYFQSLLVIFTLAVAEKSAIIAKAWLEVVNLAWIRWASGPLGSL